MKKLVILISIITILISSTVYAFSLGETIMGGNSFVEKGEAAAPNVTPQIAPVIVGLVTAGLGIGTIVAICAGIVVAIKTMTDGAYGKANLKEALTPYLIGCIVLFATFSTWSAAVQMFEGIFGTDAITGTGGITPPSVATSISSVIGANLPEDVLSSYSGVTYDHSTGYYFVDPVVWYNTGISSVVGSVYGDGSTIQLVQEGSSNYGSTPWVLKIVR